MQSSHTSKTAYVSALLNEALSELDEDDPIIDQIIDLLTHLINTIKKKERSSRDHNSTPQTGPISQQFKGSASRTALKKPPEVKITALDQLSCSIDPISCRNQTSSCDDFSLIQDLTSPKSTTLQESSINTPKASTQHSTRSTSQVTHSYFKNLSKENKALDNKNTLDLSSQPEKLTKVPISELALYGENLLNLNLSGNAIPNLTWDFPSSLILLNISNNELSEISFPKPLPNLKLLNISCNKIRRTSGIQMCKNLEEVYFSHNKLIGVATICQLGNLTTLDISYNSISNCEDVATLSICARLTVLDLKGNPLASRENYTENIKSLLPKVQILDPESIRDFSNYSAVRAVLFSESKEQAKEALSLTLPTSKIQSASGKVLKSDPQIPRNRLVDEKLCLSIPVNLSSKVNTSKEIEQMLSNQAILADSYSEPATKRSPQSPQAKTFDLPLPIRELTPKRILRSGNQSDQYIERTPSNQRRRPSSATGIANLIRDISPSERTMNFTNTPKVQYIDSTLSFISQAENRLIRAARSEDLSFNSNCIDQDHKSVRKFTLVTQESINKLNKVQYGNPIAAMMIGPPVVNNRAPIQSKQKQKRKTTPVRKVSLSRR